MIVIDLFYCYPSECKIHIIISFCFLKKFIHIIIFQLIQKDALYPRVYHRFSLLYNLPYFYMYLMYFYVGL